MLVWGSSEMSTCGALLDATDIHFHQHQDVARRLLAFCKLHADCIVNEGKKTKQPLAVATSTGTTGA